jgi:hypothetical protein
MESKKNLFWVFKMLKYGVSYIDRIKFFPLIPVYCVVDICKRVHVALSLIQQRMHSHHLADATIVQVEM